MCVCVFYAMHISTRLSAVPSEGRRKGDGQRGEEGRGWERKSLNLVLKTAAQMNTDVMDHPPPFPFPPK